VTGAFLFFARLFDIPSLNNRTTTTFLVYEYTMKALTSLIRLIIKQNDNMIIYEQRDVSGQPISETKAEATSSYNEQPVSTVS
jgi:hypothetical protein